MTPNSSAGPGARDRDALGRARNARPRDELGRPLPYGSVDVPRQPEGIPRTPQQTLDEAQSLLDAGRPFHAHEVFEDAWKAAAGPERALWKALAQLAVGLTHHARGNPRGSAVLVGRASAALRVYPPDQAYGVDVAGLLRWCDNMAAEGTPTRLRIRPDDTPGAAAAPSAGT
jgi:hypothetical protein